MSRFVENLLSFNEISHHSAKRLRVGGSSSVRSQTLRWQRQTSLLICWILPLPLLTQRKMKRGKLTFSPLSSRHGCPARPCSNSQRWHTRRLYATVFLSVCLCVREQLWCVRLWDFYNMFNIPPQGLANSDNNSNDATKEGGGRR